MNLAQRYRQAEIMDQPDLDPTEHRAALHVLQRANRLCGIGKILWRAIRQAWPSAAARTLSILDVGCGGGDVLCDLGMWAARDGIPVSLCGCDRSQVALSHAHELAARRRLTLTTFPVNVLADPIPAAHDVVYCTKFLHHFDDSDALALLTKLRLAAGRLVLVDDHVRSRLGYWLTYLGTRFLSRSRVAQTDGPLSVRAAFTLEEIRSLARQAGFENASIHKHWPEHFLLTWQRPA